MIMGKYIYTIVLNTLISINISIAQNVLFEDQYTCLTPGNWDHFVDTLEAHGAIVYRASESGRDILMDMDMLMLIAPHHTLFEDSVYYPEIFEFVRGGGNVLIWIGRDAYHYLLNQLLNDTEWRTTTEIQDTNDCPIIKYIIPFSPFTNGYDSLIIDGAYLFCGDYSFPFAFVDSSYWGFEEPMVTIIYPFSFEGNCSSFVLITSGVIHYWRAYINTPEKYRFGANLVLGCAGVHGYELEPGAIPGGGNACELAEQEYTCSRAPNPFTPNGDGINDYCQFTFEGIGEREATIYIHDMYSREVRRIEVPTGATAKWAARWDGRDDNGNPLPPGIYLYTIESGGEQICEGSVVIAR